MAKLRKSGTLIVVLCVFLALCSCGQAGSPQGDGAATTTAAPAATTAQPAATSAAAQTQAADTAATAAAADPGVEYLSSTGIKMSAPNVFPIVEEPVEMTFFCTQSAVMLDMETNLTTTAFEEFTNVRVNWIMAPEQELTTMLNLSLASRDYPDAYMCTFNTDQILSCIEGDILLPMNDLIEQYGYNTKNVLAEHPEFTDYLTAPDGNIYTLLYTDCGLHMYCNAKMYVYGPWFEALGIEMPQTTDEFRDMLMMFKEQDMNGDGDPNDEIPLMSSSKVGHGDPLNFLMNAFQLFNGPLGDGRTYFVADENRQLQFVANTESWREGLTYVHGLFTDGLLAPETYIQDQAQLRAIVNVQDDKDYVVGAASAFWQGQFIDTALKFRAWEDFVAVPPLAGPSGVRQIYSVSGDQFLHRGAITKVCKDPEIVMKWLDYWLSDDGNIAQTNGWDGQNLWSWVDEDSVLGTRPSLLQSATLPDNYRWSTHQVPKYDKPELRYGVPYNPANNAYVLYSASTAYEPYYVSNNLPMVVWPSDTSIQEDRTYYATAIEDYVASCSTQFILGEMDISSDWDAYVAELENMGVNEYTEIMQNYYFGQ